MSESVLESSIVGWVTSTYNSSRQKTDKAFSVNTAYSRLVKFLASRSLSVTTPLTKVNTACIAAQRDESHCILDKSELREICSEIDSYWKDLFASNRREIEHAEVFDPRFFLNIVDELRLCDAEERMVRGTASTFETRGRYPYLCAKGESVREVQRRRGKNSALCLPTKQTISGEDAAALVREFISYARSMSVDTMLMCWSASVRATGSFFNRTTVQTAINMMNDDSLLNCLTFKDAKTVIFGDVRATCDKLSHFLSSGEVDFHSFRTKIDKIAAYMRKEMASAEKDPNFDMPRQQRVDTIVKYNRKVCVFEFSKIVEDTLAQTVAAFSTVARQQTQFVHGDEKLALNPVGKWVRRLSRELAEMHASTDKEVMVIEKEHRRVGDIRSAWYSVIKRHDVAASKNAIVLELGNIMDTHEVKEAYAGEHVPTTWRSEAIRVLSDPVQFMRVTWWESLEEMEKSVIRNDNARLVRERNAAIGHIRALSDAVTGVCLETTRIESISQAECEPFSKPFPDCGMVSQAEHDAFMDLVTRVYKAYKSIPPATARQSGMRVIKHHADSVETFKRESTVPRKAREYWFIIPELVVLDMWHTTASAVRSRHETHSRDTESINLTI